MPNLLDLRDEFEKDYAIAIRSICDLRDYIKLTGPAGAHGALMEISTAERNIESVYRILMSGKEPPLAPKKK